MPDDSATSGWQRWWSVERAGRTALIAAALISLPFCAVGIFLDDYHQQLLIEGISPLPGTRWDLFTMVPRDPALVQQHIELGRYPWWMSPTTAFVFVRPLSVALTNLDHWLFGRAFWVAHLHSIAWYLAVVATVTLLLRRALGATSAVAALAAVLFSVSGPHAMPVGWLANRNALVAVLFALLGVLAHVRWREANDWRFLPLSLLGYAAGLAGAEAGVGALAYLAAYELTVGPGSWRRRVGSLVPALLLGVAFVAVHHALGAGARDSEMYVDPRVEPLRYLSLVPAKSLALVGGLVFGTTDFWLMSTVVPVVFGVIALALLVVVGRRVWAELEARERAGLTWLLLGGALSLLPVMGSFPMNRLLLSASVASCALVAAVLHYGWSSSDRVARLGARVLLVSAVLGGLMGWPVAAGALRLSGDLMTRMALETPLSDEALSKQVVVFSAPDAGAAMYANMVRRWHHKPTPQSWTTLSCANYAHRLTRIEPQVLELELVDGHVLGSAMEKLFRSERLPIEVGMRVQLPGFALTVVGLHQGLPSRVRLAFDDDPERGQYTFASFDGETLKPVALPAVGQTLDLPRAKSLLSM